MICRFCGNHTANIRAVRLYMRLSGTAYIVCPDCGCPLSMSEIRAAVREQRYNHNHDSKGRFCSGSGTGGGSSKGKPSKKSNLTKGKKSVKLDSYGKPYKYPEVRLPPKEYANVMDEIGRWYDSYFKNIPFCKLEFTRKTYYFENHGLSDYNIYAVEDT